MGRVVQVSEVVLVLFHPLAVHSLYDDPADEVLKSQMRMGGAHMTESPPPHGCSTSHLVR